MTPNKRRILSSQIIVGCIALVTYTSPVSAKWAFTPYSVVHAGARLKTDWSANYYQEAPYKVYPTGVPVFVGVGALVNPTLLDGWSVSLEGMYHMHTRGISLKNIKEQGGFVTAKIAFPQSEGIESFIGVGAGYLWLTEKPKEEKESKSALSAMVYAGRSWHINNGVYLTLRGTHIFPSGENRKQSFSATLGLHWHWI